MNLPVVDDVVRVTCVVDVLVSSGEVVVTIVVSVVVGTGVVVCTVVEVAVVSDAKINNVSNDSNCGNVIF